MIVYDLTRPVDPRPARRSKRALWDGLPFELDAPVQRFVATHPDGATQAEVGAFLGVSKMRVCQLEARALAKLRDALGVEL